MIRWLMAIVFVLFTGMLCLPASANPHAHHHMPAAEVAQNVDPLRGTAPDVALLRAAPLQNPCDHPCTKSGGMTNCSCPAACVAFILTPAHQVLTHPVARLQRRDVVRLWQTQNTLPPVPPPRG